MMRVPTPDEKPAQVDALRVAVMLRCGCTAARPALPACAAERRGKRCCGTQLAVFPGVRCRCGAATQHLAVSSLARRRAAVPQFGQRCGVPTSVQRSAWYWLLTSPSAAAANSSGASRNRGYGMARRGQGADDVAPAIRPAPPRGTRRCRCRWDRKARGVHAALRIEVEIALCMLRADCPPAPGATPATCPAAGGKIQIAPDVAIHHQEGPSPRRAGRAAGRRRSPAARRPRRL